MGQARAGIQRIHEQQKAKKAEALSQAKAVEGGDEAAILAIASLAQNQTDQTRQKAIQSVASIFNLDAYTARMKIPSAGFRIHRIGPWGEVSYYQKALQAANVPALSVKVNDIKGLQTFQICHFESLSPQLTVICKSVEGRLGKISFESAEISQQVSGQLPIFEQVVDIGNWGKTVHKEKVQDYAQVMDLHLPERKIVLRVCDRLYQYKQGISTSTSKEINSRIQWNQLLTHLNAAISTPHHDDFTRFGQGALEFVNLLPPINPKLDIDRRAPSHWDQAFHIYSSLCYWNNRQKLSKKIDSTI